MAVWRQERGGEVGLEAGEGGDEGAPAVGVGTKCTLWAALMQLQ